MRQRPEQAIDVLNPIVPANPFKLVNVIVDVPDEPMWMLRDAGVALMPKSGGGGGGGEGVAGASFDRGPSPAALPARTWEEYLTPFVTPGSVDVGTLPIVARSGSPLDDMPP